MCVFEHASKLWRRLVYISWESHEHAHDEKRISLQRQRYISVHFDRIFNGIRKSRIESFSWTCSFYFLHDEVIKQKKLEKQSSTCRFSPSMLLWTSSSLKVYNYYCSSERKISRWSSEYNNGGKVCRILSLSWQTSNEWKKKEGRKRKSPLASFNLNVCFLAEGWWTGNGRERERKKASMHIHIIILRACQLIFEQERSFRILLPSWKRKCYATH